MATHMPHEARILPEQMSPVVQAFLGEIGRSGVSDTAFKLALLMVPMLSFGSWQTVLLRAVAKRAGISRADAYVAVDELISAGVLERRLSGFAARKMQAFRLCERFQAANSNLPLSNRLRERRSESCASSIGAECVREYG
ncbi:hypothetical protein [Burkholderia pseudomallei]|uniref:hypothetical protein n=1 Tax=Burkholderia pseudomallei TaxID=28450 RepID=UPI0005383220|nr:hypothetical protein [Burkholderia pseudomallei]KGW18072.1 hypothetical protein X980_5962 [Burkholderia pseudomallei MSHR4000]KGW80952.1 hypothetical protein Y048_4312 [Burkholderia pseudomallei MSHR456]KGX23822.1 hypothetical protein X896_6226 [Burkholderia pseudomallei ABCPW 1]MBF3523824.1 hypothetical protein [Burkholderia pseudomallei]MBF3536850.1 hypothetical protein [Burkholderia pseudomallei]